MSDGAKLVWKKDVSHDGLPIYVGAANGVTRYFIARLPADAGSGRTEVWRLGISQVGLISNRDGETKWFATLRGAKSWANRQPHREPLNE